MAVAVWVVVGMLLVVAVWVVVAMLLVVAVFVVGGRWAELS